MSHLLFVETTGLGVQALAHAKRSGHTVTYLHCPLYDFTASPAQRREAIQLADHSAAFTDPLDGDSVHGALLASGADPESVDAVLSTLSYGAQAAADLAARIGARGTSPAGTLAARDKGECRRVLRERGVPSVGFHVVTDAAGALEAAEAIGYPVIVKPVLGIGKAVTSIAPDPAAVRAHFAVAAAERDGLTEGMARQLDERYLVEELVSGDLYSVEVAASGGRLVPLVCASRKVSRENPVLELGCTVPSGLTAPDEAALGRYAVDVCRALGLDLGVFHVEVMHTPSGFRLIEVNPRLTGGSLPDTISSVAGVDVFALLVDLFLGGPLPDAPLPLRGSASHSFLAAPRKSTVPSPLRDDWFAPFLARLHSGHVRVGAGDVVPPMRTNFDSFGMLRALAPTPAEAEAACSAVKADIEDLFGFPLLAERTRTPAAVA
ncbi:acetyl-CoA carboxylase biotin carboxylase subunit family protein [Streptomyces sp. NPDC088745]|uniref:ATP-grasp domain-containing protein n=1 Tax=Streptomyces sp. NPDC088745 TaxID=3365884 RepID=UPI0037F8D1B9